jgi:protein-S-isoprenylcysteine O-methyltransferase Ste14
MALKEEMCCSGNWMFRRRGWIPLLFAAFFLGTLCTTSKEPGHPVGCTGWEGFCLMISLCGLGLRAITLGSVAPGTSGRNTTAQRADALNTQGVYSLVRHPLYLANYLCWLGLMLIPGIWWLPLTMTLGFWLYYERIMMAEEEYLAGKFGAVYTEWAARTPAFVPRPWGWVRPENRFSIRFVMRREYATWLGVAASFVLIEYAHHLVIGAGLRIGAFWKGVALVALAQFLLLRTLRKHTSLLHTAGR